MDPRILNDFRNFCYIVWRHLGLPEPTPLQYDIATYLQHGPKRIVIEGFRGVAKSWITSAFVPWNLLRDPQLNILVVSASKQRADDFSTFTQRLIREMPELASLLPRSGQRDSKVAFDVGPAQADHAPSVKSVGITSQIAGSRADIIVVDDVEVPGNSGTQMMRDKLGEAVKEFDAVLKPDDPSDIWTPIKRIIYLGTPQTEMSLYNELPNRGYESRIWPARFPDKERQERYGGKLAPFIIHQLEENPALLGRSTEPTRFTEIDLVEREASYGRSGFALQYMLDTQLSDLERYPLKLSDLIIMDLDSDVGPEKVIWSSSPNQVLNDLPNVGLTGDKYYGPLDFVSSNQDRRFIPFSGSIMYIDPAGRGADETSYVVLKILNSQLFLLEAGGLQDGYSPETLTKLAATAARHKVNFIQVEANFGDGMFSALLKPVLGQIYPVSIEEVKHSTNKENRIIDTLEPVMNQHRLIVSKQVVIDDWKSIQGYPERVRLYYSLFHQLTRITREKGSLAHDDRLDALAGAVAYWTNQMSRDQEAALSEEKDRLLMAELHKFMSDSGVTSGRTGNQWMTRR